MIYEWKSVVNEPFSYVISHSPLGLLTFRFEFGSVLLLFPISLHDLRHELPLRPLSFCTFQQRRPVSLCTMSSVSNIDLFFYTCLKCLVFEFCVFICVV